ncbi:MAG: hypothetical protein LUH11_00015 [Candidatus Gastranaerophilales bacterium]|nr:hypothetical protein [Candidatus Gastranaerophilales bacterium]
MKVQAVNSMMSANNSRNAKQVNFEKRKTSEIEPILESVINEPENDTYTQSEPYTIEQKYDLACRLAAYYKTQYEQLSEGIGCIA